VPTIYKDSAYDIQGYCLQYTKTGPTTYKDSPYNVHRQSLQCTKTVPTMYKDSPYNVQRQSLQCTKTVSTIYKDSPYNVQSIVPSMLINRNKTKNHNNQMYEHTDRYLYDKRIFIDVSNLPLYMILLFYWIL
jgi:hypothetical protein